MTASIKDVAQQAGVSTATVSRVLNQAGKVSAETRRKVLAAVASCHYVPNANAQQLKRSTSRNICLCVRGITNPFFAAFLRVIERQISLRGYPLLIEAVDDSQDELAVAQRVLSERRLCGVLFLGGTYLHQAEDFERLGDVPRVLITFNAPDSVAAELYSSVVVADRDISRQAVRHLADLGHRRIAFMAKSPFEENTTGHLRMAGYRDALREAGLPFDPALVFDCEYRPDSGFSSMKAALTLTEPVTAVYAAADTIAIGAAKAVLSQGLSIPRDISIIGFDGIDMAEYYHPSLDTVLQPAETMAKRAVEILFDLMNGGSNQHIVLPAQLTRRGSTGPALL
ncbi:MAG: LacI family DNA-binding transcriptional regulator [Oscillospiraceae bacterium]|nr:LacI family DNA-binding transcriptional regulator [Oscillospiraceae bacterium]